ncbi:MAG TPA: hypothetical protein ENN18_04175 [Proteobacteria bacterium]|nr:hypothetical protein [Pseudomonadota bacterium]
MGFVLLRKAASVSEDDLRDFIGQYPAEVQEGLTILKRDLELDDFLVDFFGHDRERRLTILQVRPSNLEAHLLSSLAAIGWILGHKDYFSNLYGREALNLDLMPRLILVSPYFPPSLIASTNFIKGADLVFYTANIFQVDMVRDTGAEPVRGILLERIPVNKTSKEEQKVVLRSHVYAIEEKWLRDLCIDFIKKLRERVLRVRLFTRPDGLVLRLPGDETVYVNTGRDYFQVHLAKREYSSRPIRSLESYRHFWDEFEAFLKGLGQAPGREKEEEMGRGETEKIQERKGGFPGVVSLRENFICTFPATNTLQ